MSNAEKQRYDEIVKIQNYLTNGFSATQICNLMHTTYKRIRKYATGDPRNLCLFHGNFEKYPCLEEMKRCIADFREIYVEKSTSKMDEFISKYSNSSNKNLATFANGLSQDKDAVINSVTSKWSNGFVEGNNNKVKTIKRCMYGRAKIKLLSAKVIYG